MGETGSARRDAPTSGDAKGHRCPMCGRAARHEVRPFCSRRCAEVDLGRWLRGVYRAPSDERPGDETPVDDGAPDLEP